VKKPEDCSIFGTVCTPRNPIGSCMVSAEGVCAAYYKYRRRALPAAGESRHA
jgi:hydrogenase expression/formation protein HypD